MQITDYFDRIYIVNLPERTDRRKAMERELNRAKMPLHPHKVELFPAIRPSDTQGFPSIGARGCFLSHLTILKQAQAEQLANVLILEDDLAISQPFQTEQAHLVDHLQQTPWDFVYFGHVEEAMQPNSSLLQPFSGPLMTTHFYAINHTILNRLLEFLEALEQRPPGHPDGGPMHLDGAYSTFRSQNPDVMTLIAVPSLGGQRSSRSDIYPNAWYDRTPLIRNLVGMARAGKAWLPSKR